MPKTRRIFMPRIFPVASGGFGASVLADLEETEPDQPRRRPGGTATSPDRFSTVELARRWLVGKLERLLQLAPSRTTIEVDRRDFGTDVDAAVARVGITSRRQAGRSIPNALPRTTPTELTDGVAIILAPHV
jgi:hypothetical protein